MPSDLAPTVIFLQEVLRAASAQQPILLLLDSVDEVATDPDRGTLSWIPSLLPPHCKVL